MKSSIRHVLSEKYDFARNVPRYPPLNSLQYAPRKNAALFKGALVAPSSLTFGVEAGRDAGSRKGWDEDSPG